jgi:hypothetical protein
VSTLAETALMAAHHLRNLPATRESDDIRIAKALEEAAADGDQGIVNYWRNTYQRRTEEARRYHGALIAISEQVHAIEGLYWWQFRKRRLHWLAIRDTLTIVLDEGMITRGSRVG